MNSNSIMILSAPKEKTTQSTIKSKRPDEQPSIKRLILHISQSEKNRFSRLKKDYLFQSSNYMSAGSNTGFFSYCLDLLVSDDETKKLPKQYISYIGRRGKRSKMGSENRNIAVQLNLENKSYLKYLTLIYYSTGGSPDISTAQFFPNFLDLVEDLKLS